MIKLFLPIFIAVLVSCEKKSYFSNEIINKSLNPEIYYEIVNKIDTIYYDAGALPSKVKYRYTTDAKVFTLDKHRYSIKDTVFFYSVKF